MNGSITAIAAMRISYRVDKVIPPDAFTVEFDHTMEFFDKEPEFDF